MIRDLVTRIASQMNIALTDIAIVDGLHTGCSDADLICLALHDKNVRLLAYHSELDLLHRNIQSFELENRIRSGLIDIQNSSTVPDC